MRVRLEQVLRGIVIAVLAVMLWQSLHQQLDAGRPTINARGMDAVTLAKWSVLPNAPSGIHVQLRSVPSPLERAWLGAIAGAGSNVTWSGDLPALMVDAQPIASPTGGTRIVVAAPSGSSVVLTDAIGVIDTVAAQNHGAALTLAALAGGVSARVNGSVASTVPADSLVLRRVLVIGTAGWESKFVVAALEEEGWKVDAFIRVAPTVDVTQGSAAVIDTSRYSAVVALDGAVVRYASRIVEFARSGGGVVLAPQAASVDAMTPLRVGDVSRANSQTAGTPTARPVTLSTLPLVPITALRNDAIAIERRGGAVAIGGRRIGAGRALQLGYLDTWRWRTAGGEHGVQEHRAWWTGLISSASYSPRISRMPIRIASDEAPLAGLVATIGPTGPIGLHSNLSATQLNLTVWLFVLLAAGLLGEVASRRFRGEA